MDTRRVGLYAIATLLASGAALAQTDEFNRLAMEGAAQQRAGRYAEAANTFESAVKLAGHGTGPNLQLAWVENTLGLSYDKLARYPDARIHYRRALALMERARGKQDPDYAYVLANLAGDYAESGDPDSALAMFREAIATYEKTGSADDPQLALTRSLLGELLLSMGRFGDAEEPLQKSMAVFERLPQQEQRLAVVLNNLGALRRFQSRAGEAESYFRRSLAVMEKDCCTDHPQVIEPLNNLALAQMDGKDMNGAKATLERAKSIAEARLGVEHPIYARVLLNYGLLLERTGHKSEGRKLQAQAREVLRAQARTSGAGLTVDAVAFRR